MKRIVVLLAAACFLTIAAADQVSARGCGGGGCGGGGTTVINPPIGGVFRDPVQAVDLDPDPRVVEVDLVAKYASVKVNGINANLMTYNGCFPGPTIRAHAGDILKVHMRNMLPYTNNVNLLGFQRNLVNLHTHGLHVSPDAPADYVMYHLMSGETYEHEYDLSLQVPSTYNLYHPHGHGSVAEQFWAGLVGSLIIEDENDALAGYETHEIVLKDISLSGSNPEPHSRMCDYMNGKEGNTVMVNGQVNPRLYVKKGQVQRWRILNASNARFYKLSLENHSMYLIGTDGGLLDKPYKLSEIILSPSERIDVLVKATASSGNYRLRAMPYARMGMMTTPTITLMTLTYNGVQTPSQNIPTTINPDAVRIDPNSVPIAAERVMTLSMGRGYGYINGQTWDVDPYEIHSTVNTYEKWTIINMSNMDHPFHQHVNGVQVLSISGGDPGYASLYTSIPAIKDTVLIPKGGSATLLVPIMDYTGDAMFHCHILEHEDIGMMGHWHIMDDMGGM